MKFNLFSYIQREVLRRTSDGAILVEAENRRGNTPHSRSINYEVEQMMAKSIKDLVNAVAMATDREEPERGALEDIHKNFMYDNHLASVIETRLLFAQRSAFKFVDEKGEENLDVSQLFERPWMDELIAKVLMRRFKGTTLLEFYDLNKYNELEQINEIPQAHFNPFKGIILKERGDTTGWDYRSGAYSKFYLQIGRNDDLGVLTQVGLIVLAKKLGFGALTEYIDKFGVPSIFITTDREDQNRIDELVEAAKNYKRNNWMVGKGNEKFEIGKADGGASVVPHERMIEICNNEISKRILGGTGITDEKSFVGSAEIQYKLAKDRFESDKLYFKYIFNAYVKPILINLSPVYSVLEKYTFEWDNSETLSQKEKIEAINTLGTQFEIDPEYVTQVTGIPITGIKQYTPPTPEGGGGEKKEE